MAVGDNHFRAMAGNLKPLQALKAGRSVLGLLRPAGGKILYSRQSVSMSILERMESALRRNISRASAVWKFATNNETQAAPAKG